MRTIVACTLAAGLAATAVMTLPEPSQATTGELLAPGSKALLRRIDHWRRRTWYWQHVIGVPRWPTAYLDRKTRSLTTRYAVLHTWKRRALHAKHRALRPPYQRGWLCIHRREAAWNANTGNGYYGGLQMNIGFQRRYGAWLLRKRGPAHRWTPLEQIWVAEHARRVQGWGAWPNTARACGLT